MGKFRRIGLEEQGVAMSKFEGHKHRNKRSSENLQYRFSDDLLSFKALTVYSGHFSAGLLSMTALNWF